MKTFGTNLLIPRKTYSDNSPPASLNINIQSIFVYVSQLGLMAVPLMENHVHFLLFITLKHTQNASILADCGAQRQLTMTRTENGVTAQVWK